MPRQSPWRSYVQQAQTAERGVRRPVHVYGAEQSPLNLALYAVAPIRPGETIRGIDCDYVGYLRNCPMPVIWDFMVGLIPLTLLSEQFKDFFINGNADAYTGFLQTTGGADTVYTRAGDADLETSSRQVATYADLLVDWLANFYYRNEVDATSAPVTSAGDATLYSQIQGYDEHISAPIEPLFKPFTLSLNEDIAPKAANESPDAEPIPDPTWVEWLASQGVDPRTIRAAPEIIAWDRKWTLPRLASSQVQAVPISGDSNFVSNFLPIEGTHQVQFDPKFQRIAMKASEPSLLFVCGTHMPIANWSREDWQATLSLDKYGNVGSFGRSVNASAFDVQFLTTPDYWALQPYEDGMTRRAWAQSGSITDDDLVDSSATIDPNGRAGIGDTRSLFLDGDIFMDPRGPVQEQELVETTGTTVAKAIQANGKAWLTGTMQPTVLSDLVPSTSNLG